MTQAAIAAQIHQALDVHGDVTAQIAFDQEVAIDDFADLDDLGLGQIADPAGRLVWASPTLPGARHDMGAAREHGIIDAIADAGVRAVADTAYQGGSPAIRVPQRCRISRDSCSARQWALR